MQNNGMWYYTNLLLLYAVMHLLVNKISTICICIRKRANGVPTSIDFYVSAVGPKVAQISLSER